MGTVKEKKNTDIKLVQEYLKLKNNKQVIQKENETFIYLNECFIAQKLSLK